MKTARFQEICGSSISAVPNWWIWVTLAACGLFAGVSNAGVHLLAEDGLTGGARWDAAPSTHNGNERSLAGGLRFAMEGLSYTAFLNQFTWDRTPTTNAFREAVEQAFAAWTVPDPVTGLGTGLSFVHDFGTPVVGSGQFGGVNFNGAEIDLFGTDAGDTGRRGVAYFWWSGTGVTLTSGTPDYHAKRIVGADIHINSNPGAVYTLDLFRRLLTHEIGHALGLGDLEDADSRSIFIDDNYDGSTAQSALETLTNPWVDKVNPFQPHLSNGLSTYTLSDGDPGIDTPGVDLLMESFGLGIGTGNPVTNLSPLTHDEFGTRQYLYPYVMPGDTDGDSDIDDTDLGVAISNFTGPVGGAGGKLPTNGDTDGDSDVDDTDLGVSIAGFTGPLGPTAVPEPGSIVLLAVGGSLTTRRRGKSTH